MAALPEVPRSSASWQPVRKGGDDHILKLVLQHLPPPAQLLGGLGRVVSVKASCYLLHFK